jgi:hypothetical protein
MNFVDPTGLKNCPTSATNCVETPESANNPSVSQDQSEESQSQEDIVVTAHRERKFDFTGSVEFSWYIDIPSRIVKDKELRHIKDVPCGDRTTTVVNALRPPPGSSAIHSHQDVFGRPGEGRCS